MPAQRCPGSPPLAACRPAPASCGCRAGWPPALGPWTVQKRRGRFADAKASRADVSRRVRKAAEDLGPDLHQARPDHLVGRGAVPGGARRASSSSAATRCRPSRSRRCARSWRAELGTTLEATFEWFDRQPLAAASIAQVHAARLRTGEPVVVKVQRPTVDTLVRKDLRAMAWLAPHLVGRIPVAALANPPALVELFAETITEELDFRLEAENMLDVARVLADLGQRGYVVPRPHPTLVTRRVLVMERLDGFKLRRRRGHAGGRHRHRGGGPHRHGRLHGGRHDPRHLPRRPARREPVRDAPTAARRCSTSASSAASPARAASPSCGSCSAPRPTT